ncbi:MAG TPA: GC-type dockerin domain-anchored protein, partial [Phycisphaerales bacterium]|nr:GC-type dockerin domain-anchored protein [Phycisphaerales bacterium]
ADDRIALTGGDRNNLRKLAREGEQPPAAPAGSLTQSLTGFGPVTCTNGGWSLVPASVRIPGENFDLARPCLSFYNLLDPQAVHRVMTVGDAAAEAFGVAQGSPGVVTDVYNARVHRDAVSPSGNLSFTTEARVAAAIGQTALRRQVSGRIDLAMGTVNYTLDIGQGDALLNTPGFTYTSSLTTGYSNSSGRATFVFDGTTDPGLSMSDNVFCTSDSPFTARLREDDPAPGGIPAGARIATMEVCSLSTDGTALLYTGFRNAPGAEAGLYAFSPNPSNQFQLLARLGETMTVNDQARTVVNINATRGGTGSNGEDGRSRKIVPQGAAVVLLLDNSTRAVKLWRGAPPAPCTADVGVSGGLPGADGLLDNNDFVVYVDTFFAQAVAADIGVTGGLPGADGEWNNNDFVVYIDLFFAGC